MDDIADISMKQDQDVDEWLLGGASGDNDD